MVTQVTQGIKVSAQARFEKSHSRPGKGRFVFSYKITIENQSQRTVQLIGRHWIISNSDLNRKEVSGKGVIGQQPVLAPGEVYHYSSWCPLATDLGRMHGVFTMKEEDGTMFEVMIPAFILCYSPKLN